MVQPRHSCDVIIILSHHVESYGVTPTTCGLSRGRGHGRRLPHYQLCHKEEHYASQRPHFHTFAHRPTDIDANFTQAFQAQCHVNGYCPDWCVDADASSYMTLLHSTLDSASTYSGNDCVVFGNGNTSKISHIGTSSLSLNIALEGVLVVPNLTKNLLFVSKLTEDNPDDVTFYDNVFVIQNWFSKAHLA
ncbi:hypothetical protein Tco_0140089 [Tanacetum coccineum]